MDCVVLPKTNPPFYSYFGIGYTVNSYANTLGTPILSVYSLAIFPSKASCIFATFIHIQYKAMFMSEQINILMY